MYATCLSIDDARNVISVIRCAKHANNTTQRGYWLRKYFSYAMHAVRKSFIFVQFEL